MTDTQSGAPNTLPEDFDAKQQAWYKSVAGVFARVQKKDVADIPLDVWKKLIKSTYDDIDINPLYTRADELDEVAAPGVFPFIRGSYVSDASRAGWGVTETFGTHGTAADVNKPVTNVSWFAAHAYCAAQGKRLPTNDEWEFVGLASELQANGSNEPSYNRTILSWYENGSKGLKNIRQNKPNFYGVYDMHGLIWEWTSDFNSSQITSGTLKAADFCGSGAVNSSDPSNYAAFLRYGIRTSLQPNFVLHNMGFRCAK